MTCIVSPSRYKSKKALKEAAANDPATVWIEDPSLFNPWHKPLSAFAPGESCVVTNHPKRSWFAQVGRTEQGAFYVK